METNELNELNDKIISIKFTDVMKIISDDTTTPDQKMVYIYLLNVIMDIDEKVEKIKHTLKELTNGSVEEPNVD